MDEIEDLQPLPSSQPGEIMDPDWYPELPELPDSAWDIIGWLSYIADMIFYFFKFVAFLIRAIVIGIGNIFDSTGTLITVIKDSLDFLPAEVLTIIGVSLVVFLVLKLMKR